MLSGALVTIGPILEADEETLFAWINDPELVRLHGPFKPVHQSSHGEWMRQVRSGVDQVVFAIRENASDRLVGIVFLADVHPVFRSAELRIRIGDGADRGKGFGAEAVALCARHAFEDLGLNRVCLHAFASNAPALRAYEKAGFEREGLARQAAWIGGAFEDVVLMARLRT